MKNFKLIKLLALFVVLITSINTMWAGGTWYSTNMWQIWGWKTGYANDGWVKTGLGSGDDFNIGVITASSPNYTFKGLGVNTGGNKVKWVGAQVWYPNGTNGWITVGNHNDGTPGDYYWENKSIWDYSIDKNANPGDYCISIHFYMNDGGDNYNENERKINWTIPGFKTDNPTSFSFGSNSPLNLESVAKIGIRHYGTQPSLGGCVLSGTHASQFEVIDVDYSGVTVVFKPTSVGAKTATLTITDTYSKVWTVTLTGTGAANTATTRLYFNNYNYNSNWITDGALPRFTCEYTTGIYTRYPMTKCENSTYNWYADVEIKGATVNVDRYNPSSPYNTWNTVSLSGLNASNPYAVLDNYSDGTYYGFATNHPYNDVSGGYIYYDNSESDISSTLYFIIGHDYKMEDGGASSTYSKTYSMTSVTNTQLYYRSLSDTWHDADYYAVIGASSDPVGDYKWGSSSLGSKGTGGNTGIFRDILDLKTGNAYLGTSDGGGTGLTMTKRASSAASGLNYTQTIKYALSTDGGSTYPDMTSGNTPGQISVSAYKFVDGTYTSVTNTSNTATISSNTSGTYSTSVPAAYTGKTTLSADARTGYTFVDWNGASTPCNPKAATTYTARYKAHRYTIAFNKNDAQYPGTTSSGSMTSISNVVYDQNVTLTENDFEREGYSFAGWSTTPTGGVVYSDGQSVSNLSATDGATVTLYAQWTETTHTVGVAYKYGETSIHDAGSVAGVGIVTTQGATAIDITGYDFTTWSAMPSGVTRVSGDLEDKTITINATADDKTITANYTPHVYNGTVDKTTGTTDGTYSVTFKTTSLSASGMAKAGYHVDGYYLSYSAGVYDVYVADKDGNLQPSKSIGDDKYTNSSSQWIYDGNPTIYAHWAENTYTVTLERNDGTGDKTTHSIAMGANFSSFDPAITVPTRVGYTFAGYYVASSGGEPIINADLTKPVSEYFDNSSNWIKAADVTFYAHWTPVALTFNGTTDSDWSTAANWSPACVPTIEHDVTINAETTINGSAVAKSVTIGSSGKVTIQPTGVLEVAGTVTNTDDSKLIINTNSSNQGALICDLTSAPTATVNMSIPSGGFHLISSPTGGVKVSSTFAGSGIYTYAWEEGKGWDRRGYYDDFMGNEAILIYGQTSCRFSGILSNACGGSARYSTGEGVVASAQGVNMIANPLTAPIKIAAMSLTGTEGSVHIYNGNWTGIAKESAGDAVIPALQGYGVIATSGGGSVSFDYATAVRGASNKNAPLNAPKHTDSDIYDHITVSVLTNDRKVDLKLYENEQFTERLDIGWEAAYIEGDGRFGELYAVADKKMNILATPDLEGTVLGFVPGQATSYTISFEGDGKGYYLNDLDEQESTLIEEGNTYVFTPNESSNATRFVISKTPINKIITGNNAIFDGTKARKQMIDGILYIIRDGRMYDATGALVK